MTKETEVVSAGRATSAAKALKVEQGEQPEQASAKVLAMPGAAEQPVTQGAWTAEQFATSYAEWVRNEKAGRAELVKQAIAYRDGLLSILILNDSYQQHKEEDTGKAWRAKFHDACRDVRPDGVKAFRTVAIGKGADQGKLVVSMKKVDKAVKVTTPEDVVKRVREYALDKLPTSRLPALIAMLEGLIAEMKSPQFGIVANKRKDAELSATPAPAATH